MSVIVGIDLGTTYSLIGVMQAGKPVLIPNAAGETLIASAVFIQDDNTVLVGTPAKDRLARQPNRGASHFKRDMGTSRQYTIGDVQFSPEQLSSFVLRELKLNAEAWLGQELSQAVISVPAYFGEAQRQATTTAAELAGLEVIRLVNEPTAAAIAYGFQQMDVEQKIAVLDLGGGTFDVTMLDLADGIISIVSSAGDVRLGGLDFDEALAELVNQKLLAAGLAVETSTMTANRVLQAAEQAKKTLSDQASAQILFHQLATVDGRLIDQTLVISREEAELAWRPLADRLKGPIERALTDARWNPSDINEVLLVGGSSRLPLMSALAIGGFGRFPLKNVPPDETVALGTAITAGLMQNDQALADVVVTDIAPFTMGINISHLERNTLINNIYSPIIDRGTVIPCSRVKSYVPISDQATGCHLEIFQGEHPLCEKNSLIGSLKVTDIPRGPGINRSFDVRFTYDLNGLLEVEATVVATGQIQSMILTNLARPLSDEQVNEARKLMAVYKTALRDELPNTAAVARAERLYQECDSQYRSLIQEAIVQFQIALAQGDRTVIDQVRQTLNRIVDDIQATGGN